MHRSSMLVLLLGFAAERPDFDKSVPFVIA
jgi:hypothetical protein